jgi:hypothetical protein
MKKLMIATAAIALGASGAYATEGCCGTAAGETDTCKANVYEVKMSLKTLVTKKVTKNGCVGYYYDQGTRTINGYIWTCCDPCGDSTLPLEDYQITLWEKAAQVGILDGVVAGSGNGAQYTVVAEYTLDGVTYKDQLPNTYNQADVVTAAKAYVAQIAGATYVNAIPSKVSGNATVAWADTVLACNYNGGISDPMFRFGKTAEKVAVQFDVTGTGAPDSNPDVDATMYAFYAAGFGTFDKKSMAMKSVSGSVVGTVPTLALCDEYGALTDMCDDTFETWCDYTGDEYQVPAYGTWTAKYVKKMSKSLKDSVPSYDRQ